METKTIIDFLEEQARASFGSARETDFGSRGSGNQAEFSPNRQHISFHMPGHKGRRNYYDLAGYGSFLRGIMACDITEIPGADALFCPETTLRAVMDNYARLYRVKHTELLVNGSSAGVMSAIISSVPIGGKLILGRNSHHSAFSAMRLGGINPVYLRPEIDSEHGLAAGISPDELSRACAENPDAQAVLITSPGYCGYLSDISSLADIAHKHNMLMIVDQAHGAHLRFFDYAAEVMRNDGIYTPYPKHAAESLGADIVVNSTHKTLFSWTGSGILNICTDRVDTAFLRTVLRMLQTTSPSYILMGSLDINERIMRSFGAEITDRWISDIWEFYRRALRINGLTLVGPDISSCTSFPMFHYRSGLDMTKINISMAGLGISGEQLDLELRQKGIISEMVHGDYIMLMTGAGNTDTYSLTHAGASMSPDFEYLLRALQDISDSYGYSKGGRRQSRLVESIAAHLPDSADVPMEAEAIPLYQADGRVLYDPIIIYPPGSPIACPGEIMDVDIISYVASAILRGEKVTGVDEEGNIRVGRML